MFCFFSKTCLLGVMQFEFCVKHKSEDWYLKNCVVHAYPNICVYCGYLKITLGFHFSTMAPFQVLINFKAFSFSKSFVNVNPSHNNANPNDAIEPILSPNVIIDFTMFVFMVIVHFERERIGFVRNLLHDFLKIL